MKVFCLLVLLVLPFPAQALGQQTPWPRSFTGSNGSVYSIYRPQATAWDGNTISARAAVSVTPHRGWDRSDGGGWSDAGARRDLDSARTVRAAGGFRGGGRR